MKRGHLPPVDPELKRSINANLAYVRSGQAKRDAQEASAQRKLDRQKLKQCSRDYNRLKKREAALRAELEVLDRQFEEFEKDDNPLGYAEGMTAAQKQGVLEEVDAAREGCLTELLDVETDLDQVKAEWNRLEKELNNG